MVKQSVSLLPDANTFVNPWRQDENFEKEFPISPHMVFANVIDNMQLGTCLIKISLMTYLNMKFSMNVKLIIHTTFIELLYIKQLFKNQQLMKLIFILRH